MKESTSNIYTKLNDARKLVRNTKHKKAGRNEYSKYDYFTPEQVELIVAEVCEELNLIALCNLKKNEYGLYQELILINLDAGFGDEGLPYESLTFELATTMGELKATNATQQMGGTDTYSERYIKMKVFQIKDNNLDFDAHDTQKSVKTAPTNNNDFTI